MASETDDHGAVIFFAFSWVVVAITFREYEGRTIPLLARRAFAAYIQTNELYARQTEVTLWQGGFSIPHRCPIAMGRAWTHCDYPPWEVL